MKASLGTSARSLRSTTSNTSASSVGSRVKRSYARRHSSKRSSSSSSSFHDSDSYSGASLRSGSGAPSASKSKATSRNGSVASYDTYSGGSHKSNASAASTKSPVSEDNDSVFPRRSSSSVSSRRSSRSTLSFQEQLQQVAARSQHSDRSAARSSTRSVTSHASYHSNHSRRSRRSRSSRKSSLSNSHGSLLSTASSRHSSTQPLYADQPANSTRGKKASSLRQKGRTQLESKHYVEAIKTFTSAIRACESQQDWSGSDDDATNGINRAMAVFHRYRCEALYEIGLYELAANDARKSLKFEQSTTNSDQLTTTILHTEKGLALRGKTLSLLGYSLLRIGINLESAKKSFDESIELMKQAIDDDKSLTESEQGSTSLEYAKKLLKTTVDESKTGLNEIHNYEALKEKLKDSSRKGCIKDLDSILVIAPGNIDLHVQKIEHLISRKRWFEVANHCEQMAAKASRYCGVGIFKGDLLDADPFPDMNLEDLDPQYFSRNDIVVPQHLRVLPTAAVREAAFLLPKEILPYYVTSLKLEDRCDSALLIGRSGALRKAGESFDNIEQEFQQLNKTIKLREEGSVFFRNGEFDRAASLYKQCLETESGGKMNAVLHYNRGNCFYAMGKYQDATTEFTHAISIHSMYSDAILQRARCHVQMKDMKKASANFNRYLTLVEGAREHPYPPPYKGSDCFFDMPGEVTYRKVESVKAEMRKHKITPDIDSNQQHNNTQSDLSSFIQRLTATFAELGCKKDATNQVVVSNRPKAGEYPSRGNGRPTLRTDDRNLRSPKTVRFVGDPPSHAPTVRSSSPSIFQSEFDTKEGMEP
jgi:tetratricopeptide (TPR) repeat protein